MSSKLSPYAVHQIIYFLENDDRRCRTVKKTSAAPTMQYVRKVDKTWKRIYTHYFLHNPPPPMDYLRSLELMLFVKKDLDSEDMRAAFRHGKPMVFDADIPRLLVPKIIEVRDVRVSTRS
ncbi:hypothetical protein AAVH_14941 [Aphelenchoides avenae]|nr:hypothetical protein AAVH_14941 [Aphelenchus avenae]